MPWAWRGSTALADRGYFDGEEIRACEQRWRHAHLPKPLTSGAKAEGRFGKQDFVYLPEQDVYRCPAGEHAAAPYHHGRAGHDAPPLLDRASSRPAPSRPVHDRPERRITRWEHEARPRRPSASGWT